jgi:hypothetical protein
VFIFILTGCEERKLTEADCTLIKGRLEEAWERDAIAAQRKATTDVFLKFVRDEKGRVGSDWMRKCSPLVGNDVSPSDLDCLNKADTIDDVYECGF